MTSSAIRVHLGLLAVTLLAAWLSFRAELGGDASSDERGVVLVQAAEGDVERLRYEEEGRTLLLESRRDERGRWFEGEETVSAAAGSDAGSEEAAEGDGDGEAAAEPTSGESAAAAPEGAGGESQARTELFRGGPPVEAIWEQLEPLEARRVLGDLDDEKLGELELLEPRASLTVTIRGRDRRFALGGEVFGSSDRYAREDDGRVVVLPSALVRELEAGPARLMERRLVEATRPEVESLEVARGDRRLEVVQHGGALETDAFWTRAGEDEPSGEIVAWVDKFFRLQAWGYRAGEPAAGWRSEATIDVVSPEHGSETLEIWSVEEEGERRWLARSDHTRLLAELGSLAEELSQDLDGLLR